MTADADFSFITLMNAVDEALASHDVKYDDSRLGVDYAKDGKIIAHLCGHSGEITWFGNGNEQIHKVIECHIALNY